MVGEWRLGCPAKHHKKGVHSNMIEFHRQRRQDLKLSIRVPKELQQLYQCSKGQFDESLQKTKSANFPNTAVETCLNKTYKLADKICIFSSYSGKDLLKQNLQASR